MLMTKKMKNKYIIRIVPFLFIFSFTGCDQFSRFNYESFKCGYNSTGIQEVLLSKVSKGENLTITSDQAVEKIKIDEVIGDVIYFNFKNKKIKIDRKNASLTSKDGNKVTIIECNASKFKM